MRGRIRGWVRGRREEARKDKRKLWGSEEAMKRGRWERRDEDMEEERRWREVGRAWWWVVRIRKGGGYEERRGKRVDDTRRCCARSEIQRSVCVVNTTRDLLDTWSACCSDVPAWWEREENSAREEKIGKRRDARTWRGNKQAQSSATRMMILYRA
jgi:hypothetical protein